MRDVGTSRSAQSLITLLISNTRGIILVFGCGVSFLDLSVTSWSCGVSPRIGVLINPSNDLDPSGDPTSNEPAEGQGGTGYVDLVDWNLYWSQVS